MASIRPESPSLSRSSSDDTKEKIPDTQADVLEKGSLDHDAKKPSVWKRVLVGNASAENETKRAMKSRHLTMIAIGGTIGTGIFLSAGSAVAVAGPASALLSYFTVGVFCYGVVISLGEMSAYIPVSGSFATYGSRFFSPALGFTIGWNYWLQWQEFDHTELTAAAVILQYWDSKIAPWQWALILIAPIFIIQLIHVRVYGESEYWFAMIKVIMIIVFIFVGLIYDWGGVHGHPGPGLANFQNGQAFIGGFSAFAQTFVYAFYSYGGVELVSLAAGESASPHKAVPRAVRATFFRIVIFYILTMLAIGLNVNWQDPTLLNAADDSSVAASPITVVFQRAGFGAAVHVVNAVLLTAVLSATNSSFYASSRMLLALARSGQAPRIFGWVNRHGVPIPSLILSLAVACVTFLTTIWGEGVVFTWLLNLTGISSLLVWGTIGVISLRFRAAWKAQGRPLADLPYTQPLFPVLPIVTIVLAIAMFVAQGYASVVQEPFSARNVVATYIGLAVYVVCYLGYWLYELLWLRQTQHMVPLMEVDLDTDAVWAPGEGVRIHQEEAEAREKRDAADVAQGRRMRVWVRKVWRVLT